MKLRRRVAWLTPGMAALAMTGCATPPAPAMQTIEVLLEAEDPAWRGPLPCEAVNAAGVWPFVAPGSVTVQAANDALHIRCRVPAGAAAEPSDTAPRAAAATQEAARHGASAGAKVGAGAGVAIGVAAVPVMGPAVAVLLAVGSAFKGAQIGGLVAAVGSGGHLAYPSPIIVRIKRVAAPGASVSPPPPGPAR